MSNKLKIVLDTNVLLVSLSEKSNYHWVWKLILENKIELYITNEILSEYEEIITNRVGSDAANVLLILLLELENVRQSLVYYKYNLIKADTDDNKFVDCYLASNCDYIITNDKHFNVLKEINFPKINCLNLTEFSTLINELK